MLSGQKKNLFAVAKTWYQQFSVHTLSLIQSNRSVCGFHLGYLDSESELLAQVVKAVLDLYQQGKIKPRIDSTYHLEQVCVSMKMCVVFLFKSIALPSTKNWWGGLWSGVENDHVKQKLV